MEEAVQGISVLAEKPFPVIGTWQDLPLHPAHDGVHAGELRLPPCDPLDATLNKTKIRRKRLHGFFILAGFLLGSHVSEGRNPKRFAGNRNILTIEEGDRPLFDGVHLRYFGKPVIPTPTEVQAN